VFASLLARLPGANCTIRPARSPAAAAPRDTGARATRRVWPGGKGRPVLLRAGEAGRLQVGDVVDLVAVTAAGAPHSRLTYMLAAALPLPALAAPAPRPPAPPPATAAPTPADGALLLMQATAAMKAEMDALAAGATPAAAAPLKRIQMVRCGAAAAAPAPAGQGGPPLPPQPPPPPPRRESALGTRADAACTVLIPGGKRIRMSLEPGGPPEAAAAPPPVRVAAGCRSAFAPGAAGPGIGLLLQAATPSGESPGDAASGGLALASAASAPAAPLASAASAPAAPLAAAPACAPPPVQAVPLAHARSEPAVADGAEARGAGGEAPRAWPARAGSVGRDGSGGACAGAGAGAGGSGRSGSPAARLRWTDALHAKFLAAVAALGGADRTTPKAVLEEMLRASAITEELTILHIKSHLQKYRFDTGCRVSKR